MCHLLYFFAELFLFFKFCLIDFIPNKKKTLLFGLNSLNADIYQTSFNLFYRLKEV